MATVTLASQAATIEQLTIQLKQQIARGNALQAKLDNRTSGRSFGAGMNMRNPEFLAAYQRLRAEQPAGTINQTAIIAELQREMH